MNPPYTQSIPVKDEYLEATGTALYNSAYAEGIVRYLINKYIPGYVTIAANRTAPELADDFNAVSAQNPDAHVAGIAKRFVELAHRRQSLITSTPISGVDLEQILAPDGGENPEPWDLSDLWSFAEEAQSIALALADLVKGAK